MYNMYHFELICENAKQYIPYRPIHAAWVNKYQYIPMRQLDIVVDNVSQCWLLWFISLFKTLGGTVNLGYWVWFYLFVFTCTKRIYEPEMFMILDPILASDIQTCRTKTTSWALSSKQCNWEKKCIASLQLNQNPISWASPSVPGALQVRMVSHWTFALHVKTQNLKAL